MKKVSDRLCGCTGSSVPLLFVYGTSIVCHDVAKTLPSHWSTSHFAEIKEEKYLETNINSYTVNVVKICIVKS